jgi:hypothetical protein
VLIADRTTDAEIAAGRPPSYQVVIQDPSDGRWHLVNDPQSQRPFRFRPESKAVTDAADADFALRRQQRLGEQSGAASREQFRRDERLRRERIGAFRQPQPVVE